MISTPKWLKIICYLSILGSSYLISLNFSSYTNANEVDNMRTEIMREIEIRFSTALATASADEKEEMIASFNADLDQNLTVPKYKRHSLFRIVGNFITLFGALLMIRLRKMGYHLYVAGTLFLVFTGFSSMGFGLMGWTFNLFYILVGLVFSLFYTRYRSILTL